MNRTSKYKDWQVWQDAMDLAEQVCQLDWTEVFNTQIKRSAVSVPANIAEGVGKGQGATVYSFRIAKGSCAETDTFILLMRRLKLITDTQAESILKLTDSVLNQLEVLIKNIGS